MNARRRQVGRLLGALTLGAALAVLGCKGGDNLAPVAGTVTVDGQVLKTGSVSYRPDATKGNTSQHQPNGEIDASGKFELWSPPDKKGAPPGWYKVVVFALDDPQPNKPLKSFIHMKYSDEKTTPLSVEVIANPEPGRYDLKLVK